MYFISPIILAISAHFHGDLKIDVEEDLRGNRVDISDHFEMILSHGVKKVILVVAKKENFDQGRGRCYLGCEIAADLGNLSEVYGIVTNFVEWYFIKSEDHVAKIDMATLDLCGFLPVEDSFRRLTSKLIAFLSNA